MLRRRLIERIKPSRELAEKALRLAERDLGTAERLITGGDYDWALAVAYNSMLQAGRGLMFRLGYKPSSTHGHIAVLRFLRILLGEKTDAELLTLLNRARRKRHRVVYEEAEITSRREAEETLRWARRFLNRVRELMAED